MSSEGGCASGAPIRGYRERAKTRSLLPAFDSSSAKDVTFKVREDSAWQSKRNSDSYDAYSRTSALSDEGEGTVIKLCGVSLGSRSASPEPYPISRCHTLPRRAPPGGLQLQPLILVSESAPASPRLQQEVASASSGHECSSRGAGETQEPPGAAPPRPPAPSFYQWCHTFARSREATKVANHSPTTPATPWGALGPLLGAAVPRPYTGHQALREAMPNASTQPARSSHANSDAQDRLVGPFEGGQEAPRGTGAKEDPPVWLRGMEAPLPQPPVRTSSRTAPPTQGIVSPRSAKDGRHRVFGTPQEVPAVAHTALGPSPKVPQELAPVAGEGGRLSQTANCATGCTGSEGGASQTEEAPPITADPSHSQSETPQIANATAKPFCREERLAPCCDLASRVLTPAEEPPRDTPPSSQPLRRSRRGSRRTAGATGPPRAEDSLRIPSQAATPPAECVVLEPPAAPSAETECHGRARQCTTIDEIFRDLIQAVAATSDALPSRGGGGGGGGGRGRADATPVSTGQCPPGSSLALTPPRPVPPTNNEEDGELQEMFQSANSLCSDALSLQQRGIPVPDKQGPAPGDVGKNQRLYVTPDGAEEGHSVGASSCVRDDAASREGAEGDMEGEAPTAGGPGLAPRVPSDRPAFLIPHRDPERRPASMRFPLDVIRGRHLKRDGEPSRSPKQRLSVDQVHFPGLSQGSYKSKSASRIGTEGSASDAVVTPKSHVPRSHILPLDTTLEDRIRMTIDSFTDARPDGTTPESQEESPDASSRDGDFDGIRVRGVVSPQGFCLDVVRDSTEGSAGVKGVLQDSENRGVPSSQQDSPGRTYVKGVLQDSENRGVPSSQQDSPGGTCLLQECTSLPYIDECETAQVSDQREVEESPSPPVDSLGLQQPTRVSYGEDSEGRDTARGESEGTMEQPVCVVDSSAAQGVALVTEEHLGEPTTHETSRGFDHSSSSLATVVSVDSREEEEEEEEDDSFVDAYDSMDPSTQSSGSPGLAGPQDEGPQSSASSASSASSEAWWTSGVPAGPPLDGEEGRAYSLEEEEEPPDYENDFDAVDADMRRLEEKLRVFERELKEQPDDEEVTTTTPEDPLLVQVASKTKHLSLMTRLEVREYDVSASASGESEPSSSDSADFLFVRSRVKLRPGERKCRSLEGRRSSGASRNGRRPAAERCEERLDLSSLNVPLETLEEDKRPAQETLSRRPVTERCEERLDLSSLNVPLETLEEDKRPAQETLSRRPVAERCEERVDLNGLNVPLETLEEDKRPAQETLSRRPVTERCEERVDLNGLNVPLETLEEDERPAQETLSRRPATERCEERVDLNGPNVPLETLEEKEPIFMPAQETANRRPSPVKERLDLGSLNVPLEEETNGSLAAQETLDRRPSPVKERCEERLNVPSEEETEGRAQGAGLTTGDDPGEESLPQRGAEGDVSSSMLCSGEEEDVLLGCIWREEEDGMASVDFEGLEDFRSFEGRGALMIMFEDDLEDEPRDLEEEEEVLPSHASTEYLVESGLSRGSSSVTSPVSSSRSFLAAFKDGLRRASKYLGRKDEFESQLPNGRGRRSSGPYDEGGGAAAAAAGVYNVQSGRVGPVSFVPSSDSEGPEVFSCSSGEYYAAPAICVNTSDEEQFPSVAPCDAAGLRLRDSAQLGPPAGSSPPAPPPRWAQRRSYVAQGSAHHALSPRLSTSSDGRNATQPAHALTNGRDARLCLLADASPAVAGEGVPLAEELLPPPPPPPPPPPEFNDHRASLAFGRNDAKVRLREAEGGGRTKGVPTVRGRPTEDAGHRRSWPLRK